MDQHSPPAEAETDWEVVGVFDPDGDTPHFSYTVGLHTHGLPELHLWARPSEGVDPGEDWAFNERERGALLNSWARRLRPATCTRGCHGPRRWTSAWCG
jgi:hypothetical protein